MRCRLKSTPSCTHNNFSTICVFASSALSGYLTQRRRSADHAAHFFFLDRFSGARVRIEAGDLCLPRQQRATSELESVITAPRGFTTTLPLRERLTGLRSPLIVTLMLTRR